MRNFGRNDHYYWFKYKFTSFGFFEKVFRYRNKFFFEFAVPESIIAICGLTYVIIFFKIFANRWVSHLKPTYQRRKKITLLPKIVINDNSKLIGKKI